MVLTDLCIMFNAWPACQPHAELQVKVPSAKHVFVHACMHPQQAADEEAKKKAAEEAAAKKVSVLDCQFPAVGLTHHSSW